ncbi:MAG: hypothetical protein ACREOY_07575 [Candidatus Dormibacteraceae bacterium]
MPDLSHLWQRFMLASALVVGLAIGAAGTVFGYSNLTTVDVHWSIFHIDGIPLWTVAVVPLAVVLIAGTLYHWMDGLHHFSEHMRHRRRVHELEAEVASLRAHLDHVLEMPDHSTSRLPSKPITAEPLSRHETEAPALPEPAHKNETPPPNGTKTAAHRAVRTKRATISVDADTAAPTAAPIATNDGQAESAAESAASA